MLDYYHLHNGRKPMIYFTWLHQEHPLMRALVKLMHGQLKEFVSLNLRKSVSRVVCPKFSNYLHFSDNLSTARAQPGSCFSMMLFSSTVHPWTRGYDSGAATPLLAQMPTWELEERGLLITIKTTLSNYTGFHCSGAPSY